jgi:DNA-binding HxlR family transcriptional regulator
METKPAYNPMNARCPTREVLARIADKWSMLVVTALEPGTKRFSQLRRDVDGITQKMLTQTLRGLERDGMVIRTAYPTVPVTVEYTLTPLGRSLSGAVDAIREWAVDNIEDVRGARAEYDARPVVAAGPPTPMAPAPAPPASLPV